MNMLRQFVLIILLFFIFFTFNLTLVNAQSPATNSASVQINYESINPDNTFSYALKRLQEKILLFLFSIIINFNILFKF